MTDRIRKNWIFWIVLIIALTYGPFLGYRIVRMAGDDKVYVSQAIEMASHGNWFVQVLQEQPDYYKGPLHLLLIRIGLLIFGKNPWAALYMNFFLLMAGGISIGALVRKYAPKSPGAPIWAGAFFATCVGVYAHSFASQMETELACLLAMALYFLDRAGKADPAIGFWTLAGLVGWSKSPLHSLLTGLAAILYWLASGQLWSRIKNWRCWLGVLGGVFVCGVGYLPAYLLDRSNFVSIYIVRETLSKGESGQGWQVCLTSVLGFYLFPWLLLAFVAYAEAAWKLVSRSFSDLPRETRRALLLSVCWVTPSFLFFGLHPYHFENYNLPVISGVILFISLIVANRSPRFHLAYRIAALLTALVLLALPVGLTLIDIRFSPLPAWWPRWLVPLAWVGTLIASGTIFHYGWTDRLRKLHPLAIGMVGFYLALGSTLVVIGERELVSIREYVRESAQSGRMVRRLGYYNLQHNIWSEWGILNLWLDRPVYAINTEDELRRALISGDAVIVPPYDPEMDFKRFVSAQLPGIEFETAPLKRWRTQGRSESGEPLWKDAWDQRDLSVLELQYSVVRRRR